MINYSNELTGIDWSEAAEVLRLAPLSTREPEKLKRAFENSYAKVIVYDDGKLIGLARAICDGEYHAAVYDVVLLPDYQGKGIGKRMMEIICEQLPVKSIILFAVPGKEGFYKKCGFVKMKTAMGMLRWSVDPTTLGYAEED